MYILSTRRGVSHLGFFSSFKLKVSRQGYHFPILKPVCESGKCFMEAGQSTLEIAFLQGSDLEGRAPWMESQASWDLPTRSVAMKSSSNQSNIAVALASETGSLSVFLIDATNPSLDSPPLVVEHLHKSVPSALDIQKDTLQCVTVGSDGRINVVQVSNVRLSA